MSGACDSWQLNYKCSRDWSSVVHITCKSTLGPLPVALGITGPDLAPTAQLPLKETQMCLRVKIVSTAMQRIPFVDNLSMFLC